MRDARVQDAPEFGVPGLVAREHRIEIGRVRVALRMLEQLVERAPGRRQRQC